MALRRLGEAFGRRAIEGDSPVSENQIKPMEFLSSTGHVKPGVNSCRPRHKAKYKLFTDRE